MQKAPCKGKRVAVFSCRAQSGLTVHIHCRLGVHELDDLASGAM